MDSDRWTQVEKFYHAALERGVPERKAFLEHNCPDEAVRREVESLLANEQEGEQLLKEPPWGPRSDAADVPEESTHTIQMLPETSPGAFIHHYRIVRQLGEGGMGVVYLARQLEPIRRDVALKVIKPGMDSKQVIARFESERQALALMDHPNIARVIRCGYHRSRIALFRDGVGPWSLDYALLRF
jgi:serine/threonine protein kinase